MTYATLVLCISNHHLPHVILAQTPRRTSRRGETADTGNDFGWMMSRRFLQWEWPELSAENALEAYIDKRTQRNRDNVVTAYWYLCRRGAKKFNRSNVDRADLIQVGAIGLLKAVDGYRPQTGTPFEAYAWLLIVGELMHYVRDHERIVRIPRALRSLEKRYVAASDMLATRLGRHPSATEIAGELRVDITVVDEIRVLRRGGAVVSIEACLGSPVGEFAAQTAALGVDDRLTLAAAIGGLGERERLAVLGSYAVGLSQAEIGQRLGLSQSQISKLIKKALCKMQQRVA